MKLIAWLEQTSKTLQAKGIESARLESELMAAHVLKLPLAELSLHFQDVIGSKEMKTLHDFVQRRIKREPVQYILGTQGFHEIHLQVGPGVLIPRPETEVLVEAVLQEIKSNQVTKVLDVCAGSGNIALALAKARQNVTVDAVEISPEARSYAEQNIRSLNLQDRVRLFKGDLFLAEGLSGKKYDFIVSNPPYVCRKDLPGLQDEVRDFEPHLALDGGEDGLQVIRKILLNAPQFLKPQGYLLMELGMGQADAVLALCQENQDWRQAEVLPDLRQVPRVLKARIGNG